MIDPATQINIKYVENILIQAKKIHELRNELIKTMGEDNVR